MPSTILIAKKIVNSQNINQQQKDNKVFYLQKIMDKTSMYSVLINSLASDNTLFYLLTKTKYYFVFQKLR